MGKATNEDTGAALADRLFAYYRFEIAAHADDPIIGACLICRVTSCEVWRSAAERLFCGVALKEASVDTSTANPKGELR